jgi:TolA-binding protein
VATLLARPSTRLELQASADSTLVHLLAGIATFRVTKRPSEHPFMVSVGRYTVTVVGTLFSVAEKPDGRVEVSVAEGAVRVADGQAEWRVSAGERWSSDAPNQRTPDEHTAAAGPLLNAAMSNEPEGRLSELLHAMPQQRKSEAPAVKQALMAPPAGAAPASQLGASAAPTTVPSVVPIHEAPVHRPHRTFEPERLAVLEHPSIADHPPVVEPVPMAAVPPKTEATAPAASPVPVVAPAPVPGPDPYAEALALERRGDHRLAASKLQAALASNVGPRDLELYHLALLRQRHLDDPRGALEALLSYRKSFPSGGLRQEVDVSIIESRLALKQTDEALTESAAFLARYPQNERADEMHFMRGDLLRLRGDCAGALAEYRAVLRGPALEDSLYYAAYCIGELGQSDVATTALKDYLRRFPNGKHAGAARQTVGE